MGLKPPNAIHFVLKSKDGRIGRGSGCYGTRTPNGERDSDLPAPEHPFFVPPGPLSLSPDADKSTNLIDP